MADRTAIEWTDATWNPTRGCRRISPGCLNCYAERVAARFSGEGQPYHGLATMTESGPRWTGAAAFIEEHAADPLRWAKPRRIFVDSMSDLFYEGFKADEIDAVLAVMLLSPRHTFQVLTKRPERMVDYFADRGLYARVLRAADEIRARYPKQTRDVGIGDPSTSLPAHIWLGVSIEAQEYVDRIAPLLRTPARVRFLSCEPLLGPVELPRFISLPRPVAGDVVWLDDHKFTTLDGAPPVAAARGIQRVYLNKNGARSIAVTCTKCNGKGCGSYPCENGKTFLGIKPDECEDLGLGVDWVIVGGESGSGARPMHPSWARSLRDQCAAGDVPFFFKQWGEFAHGSRRGAPTRVVLNNGRSCDFTRDACLALSRELTGEWGSYEPENMARVGKKAAGRELDGRTHDAFPEVRR